MTTNTQSFYSTMPDQNNHLFTDETIQRFDADTIKNRYGSNWKSIASNVREITQPDGSIIKEYIIEDPSLLEEIKAAPQPMNSTSPPVASDDERQQPLKNRFAQIKAKFEQKNISNVGATPSTSSLTSSTTTSRQNSRKQMDDLYARHRRASNESIPINRINDEKKNSINFTNLATDLPNNYRRSQSIGSERSKASSFKRFDSADEADEEVQRIHRQGEDLRRYKQDVPTVPSSNNAPQQQQQSRIEYEVVDEDGNPMSINGVQDLIKMSGVRAREVAQPDGTIVKEYVIDDPHVVSQFRSKQQPSMPTSYTQPQQQQQQQQTPISSSYSQRQQSPMTSYTQQRSADESAPPPPPRIPLRPPTLLRQGSSTMNENLSSNIQQIHVLEPQRRYEYLTTNGQRVQFYITNSDNSNGQFLTDPDIRELTNAINNRVLPASNSVTQQPLPQIQTQYNQPRQWYPSVNLTQRQRLGSDTQPYSNNPNIGFQQIHTDLSRSSSNGALNQQQQQQQQQVFHEPMNNWNKPRYHESHNQRHQNNETFQTSAQFLPQQQMTRPTASPQINSNHSYQQSTSNYPYQGQQQHGVRILNDFNQQQSAMIPDGHARI